MTTITTCQTTRPSRRRAPEPAVGRVSLFRRSRSSAIVGASAWQHARDGELSRRRVASEPNGRLADAEPVLVGSRELAYIGAGIARGRSFDGGDHAHESAGRGDAHPVGRPARSRSARTVHSPLPNSRLIFSWEIRAAPRRARREPPWTADSSSGEISSSSRGASSRRRLSGSVARRADEAPRTIRPPTGHARARAAAPSRSQTQLLVPRSRQIARPKGGERSERWRK